MFFLLKKGLYVRAWARRRHRCCMRVFTLVNPLWAQKQVNNPSVINTMLSGQFNIVVYRLISKMNLVQYLRWHFLFSLVLIFQRAGVLNWCAFRGNTLNFFFFQLPCARNVTLFSSHNCSVIYFLPTPSTYIMIFNTGILLRFATTHLKLTFLPSVLGMFSKSIGSSWKYCLVMLYMQVSKRPLSVFVTAIVIYVILTLSHTVFIRQDSLWNKSVRFLHPLLHLQT